MALESTPPERNAPSGTSDIRRIAGGLAQARDELLLDASSCEAARRGLNATSQ